MSYLEKILNEINGEMPKTKKSEFKTPFRQAEQRIAELEQLKSKLDFRAKEIALLKYENAILTEKNEILNEFIKEHRKNGKI